MREGLQSGAQPTFGEDRRMEPECDLPQPVEGCREPFGDVGQLVLMLGHLQRRGCLRRTHLERQRDVMGVPAWKSLPSWYLVAQKDEAIPPDAERQFAARMGADTVEIPSSHVAMVSHPVEVTGLIEKAAEAVGAAAAR